MRLGIIGCGLIGQKRAAAASAGGHNVTVVADLKPELAQALAGRVKARATARWQDVVESDVDVVIIATAHDSLAPLALAAVEAGKHVLVEKPAGRNAAEIKPVVDASLKIGKLVKVGFNHRFHPALLKARELVDSGLLGPLYYTRGRYGHGARVGYEKEWRCQPQQSGGGELIDQGSHLIDLSRWFLGDLSLAFAAVPTYFWDIRTDDNCFLALEGAEGQLAWLHASWTEWKNTFSFEITGRDGKIAIDGLGGSYGTEKLTFYRMLPTMGPPETTSWEYPQADQSWAVEFAEFADAIAKGRQPIGNIQDAYALLQLIDKAYGRSAT